MGNEVSNISFRDWKVGLATMAWELAGREEEAWPLGMLTIGGEFHQTLGGCFQKLGFQNPLKIKPNPRQKKIKPTQNRKHNP